MVAFNFKEAFAPKIEKGLKTSTIRSTMRCKIGDKLQLYTRQRTKDCRLLAHATCTGIAEIRIDRDCPWSILSYIGKVVDNDKTRLHEQEGFINAKEMVDFFEEHYGLPYTGYLHKWDLKCQRRLTHIT